MTQSIYGRMLQKFLMASYLYYCCDESPMSDHEYDAISKALLDHWDEFEHQHKYLVTEGDLTAGSLFKLRSCDYPLMVVGAAKYWMRMIKQGKGQIDAGI